MKIASIRTHVVGEIRPFLFVVVETDDGIQGIGEAGITWREQAVAGFLEALAPSLLGEDPRRIEHLWQVMMRCMSCLPSLAILARRPPIWIKSARRISKRCKL